ncbi:hypothetical protein FDA94_29160 [Herbidospora galbida]|uniref:Uncharacterized protein n=1 Tax=Herbidospora galbida TaxID=2575442 RepID=A0A4U3M6X1_9ACTN|nr:hypothetical protein [Herbidospora galbida]TKK84685.1 hypothetical protein FDA94_29160 [Herbidospora galbida]
MVASYPAAIPTWSTKRNYLDIVWADHMNRVQEEIEGTQRTLGVIPQRATNNPGNRTPDHGTVAARIQSVARGEHVPYFRGSIREYKITPNGWFRPSLRADDDPFGMYTGSGLTLNESGYWSFSIKADWAAYTETTSREATRMLRLEINGNDIGVRDSVVESTANRATLHNHITWSDTYPSGTTISIGVRTNMTGASRQLALHAYLRAHWVRSAPYTGEGGSVPFEQIPDDDPGGPGTSCPDPEPRPNPRRRYKPYCLPRGGIVGYLTRTGRQAFSPLDICIIDNTSRFFTDNPYPEFETFDEAAEFRQELWMQLRPDHEERDWQDDARSVITGFEWPSM